MKKLLACFGVLVIGAVISALIDNLIGVNFTDIDIVPHIVHKVTYMVWGGVVIGINKWLKD